MGDDPHQSVAQNRCTISCDCPGKSSKFNGFPGLCKNSILSTGTSHPARDSRGESGAVAMPDAMNATRPGDTPHSHAHTNRALTAQAASSATAIPACTPSIPVLNSVSMTRGTSGDSGKRVSELIFGRIQDSFTFDSRPGRPGIPAPSAGAHRLKKAGKNAGLCGRRWRRSYVSAQ
jgi:hypothetical protein